MGMRSTMNKPALFGHHGSNPLAAAATSLTSRSFAADAGDVIGIDLGTTNSCVAVMVCRIACCSVWLVSLCRTVVLLGRILLPLIPFVFSSHDKYYRKADPLV